MHNSSNPWPYQNKSFRLGLVNIGLFQGLLASSKTNEKDYSLIYWFAKYWLKESLSEITVLWPNTFLKGII